MKGAISTKWVKKEAMAITDIFKNIGTSKTSDTEVRNPHLPKTLIVATDFSENSRAAMLNSVNTFLPYLKKIILLNAYSVPSISIGSLVTVKDILFQLSEEGLEDELRILRKALGHADVEIEIISKNGELADIVSDLKLTEESPLLCLGTTGASNIDAVYHGHTTTETTRNLFGMPIFTLPKGKTLRKPKNIIYLSDIRELDNINRLDTIVGCGRTFGATIHVAHISERNILQPSNVSAADRDLMPLYSDLYPDVNFTYQTLNGVEEVGDQLKSLADRLDADFIYMVVKEDGFLNDVFSEKSVEKKTFFNQYPVILMRVSEEKQYSS